MALGPVSPTRSGKMAPTIAVAAAHERIAARNTGPTFFGAVPRSGVDMVWVPPLTNGSAHALHGRLAIDGRQAMAGGGNRLLAAEPGRTGGTAGRPSLG